MPKRNVTRVLVLSMLFLIGCAQGLNKSTTGALTGGTLGAGLGAIVGSQTGHAGPGIAVGAAVGALGGALVGNSMDATDQEQAALRRRLDTQGQQLEENKRILEALRRRGADVRESDRGIVVNLPDVLFEFDRADLTTEARRTVADIADVTRTAADRTIAVEGHTDSVGSTAYNKRLSIDRAESVARALQQTGVPATQLRTAGYGEGRPIASNNSPEGRARNRRVEVIIENR
jgi:outer membrane protein OmpA-like peptidoglycan-associated protein